MEDSIAHMLKQVCSSPQRPESYKLVGGLEDRVHRRNEEGRYGVDAIAYVVPDVLTNLVQQISPYSPSYKFLFKFFIVEKKV